MTTRTRISLCVPIGAVSHTWAFAQTITRSPSAGRCPGGFPTPRASDEMERAHLNGSAWQARRTKQVHRLGLEYNLTGRLNIRGILGLHTRASGQDTLAARSPDQNVTVSWERNPGSFVYLVYNDASQPGVAGRCRSVAFKLTQRVGW